MTYPPNISARARWHSKFIAYLVQYLEGKLHGLTDDECEALRHMIDNPPAHIPPEELGDPGKFVEVAWLLARADERDWSLAQAMVEVRRSSLKARC